MDIDSVPLNIIDNTTPIPVSITENSVSEQTISKFSSAIIDIDHMEGQADNRILFGCIGSAVFFLVMFLWCLKCLCNRTETIIEPASVNITELIDEMNKNNFTIDKGQDTEMFNTSVESIASLQTSQADASSLEFSVTTGVLLIVIIVCWIAKQMYTHRERIANTCRELADVILGRNHGNQHGNEGNGNAPRIELDGGNCDASTGGSDAEELSSIGDMENQQHQQATPPPQQQQQPEGVPILFILRQHRPRDTAEGDQ